jgi:hypothetical protein
MSHRAAASGDSRTDRDRRRWTSFTDGSRWRGRRLALATTAAVLLGAGGLAWASIPDSGTGLIHGCYSTSTGALRVIDPATATCHTGEASLNWNAHGLNWRATWSASETYAPKDVVTLSGTTYIARVGNTNNRPPSSAWVVFNSGVPQTYANVYSQSNESDPSTFPIVVGSNLTTVAETSTIPAGNYVVTAQATVFMDNGAQDIQCLLVDRDGNFANGYAETSGPADSSSTGVVQTLTLSDAFTGEPATARILLQCAKANGADSSTSEVVSAEITAVQQTRVIYNGTAFSSPSR